MKFSTVIRVALLVVCVPCVRPLPPQASGNGSSNKVEEMTTDQCEQQMKHILSLISEAEGLINSTGIAQERLTVIESELQKHMPGATDEQKEKIRGHFSRTQSFALWIQALRCPLFRQMGS